MVVISKLLQIIRAILFYDLPGEEISILFSIEGYKDVSAIDIRSGSPNILEIEIEEGNGNVKLDYRKQVAEPWPPNYALAPIFMISALITLIKCSCTTTRKF